MEEVMNYCPKCGSLLNQGEAFCKICGAEIPLPQNNFINTTQNVNASNEQYPSFEQQPSNYTLILIKYQTMN